MKDGREGKGQEGVYEVRKKGRKGEREKERNEGSADLWLKG